MKYPINYKKSINCIKVITKSLAAMALGLVVAFTGFFDGFFSATPLHAFPITSTPIDEMRAAEILSRVVVQPMPRLRASDVVITGQMPTMLGSSTLAFDARRRIDAQVEYFINTHRTRARSIQTSFETHVYGRFVSIVITMHAKGANVTTAVFTTVIDAATMDIVNLAEFSPNLHRLVNSQLMGQIEENPRNFVSNFSGVDSNHPFYIADGILHIPFASRTLRLGYGDVYYLSLPLESIKTVTIESEFFFTYGEYNTIVVALPKVLENFDFTINWNATKTGEATILRNNEIVTVLRANQNSYFYQNYENARELELAPLFKDEQLFVPLSFFREILGLATTVSPNGYIFISELH